MSLLGIASHRERVCFTNENCYKSDMATNASTQELSVRKIAAAGTEGITNAPHFKNQPLEEMEAF
ncbi:MAG: hypothetical protein M3Y72_08695 [Acidobacteriota bacterium]|nr:hypothetical protein [Acidobacteriota bacterium]